jgi:DNA-binding response OmpR family regulator
MNPKAPYDPNSFLVVDDEYEHIEFLPDFLRAKGFHVDVAPDAGKAIEYADKKKYLGYFIDLNIPVGEYQSIRELKGIEKDYVGLRVIQDIRAQGNPGDRVIAYSAHENDTIKAAINRLYCQYIVKGRVREIKDQVKAIITRAAR